MMSGRFIAVVGPSGVGKDTVMTALTATNPNMRLARRVITRPTDAGGEVFDGVSAAQFEQLHRNGAFALWWSAHGLSYAIPSDVDDLLAQGHDVLANLSRGVLEQMKARFPRSEVIALTANRRALEARLTARGRESADDIARRLDRAEFELPTSIPIIEIDNSGPLEQTVSDALCQLYPERG